MICMLIRPEIKKFSKVPRSIFETTQRTACRGKWRTGRTSQIFYAPGLSRGRSKMVHMLIRSKVKELPKIPMIVFEGAQGASRCR